MDRYGGHVTTPRGCIHYGIYNRLVGGERVLENLWVPERMSRMWFPYQSVALTDKFVHILAKKTPSIPG